MQKQSHPSRVRGLKWFIVFGGKICWFVAPFTGAWIEIWSRNKKSPCRNVAPFTGAWIEIAVSENVAIGLHAVAPFTGAWIEIMNVSGIRGLLASHPSRVRGLKYPHQSNG